MSENVKGIPLNRAGTGIPWTPGEDKKLLQFVENNGHNKWDIAHYAVPGRTADKCRSRYVIRYHTVACQKPKKTWCHDAIFKFDSLNLIR